MKSIHMPALIRLEDMLDSAKKQLEADLPMGKDFTWNLVMLSQNIVLQLIDDLYEDGGEDLE